MPDLPHEVVLGGCRYRVQETPDCTIVFTEASPVWGFTTKLMFTKDEGGRGIWYFTAHANDRNNGGEVVAAHVARAYELVQEWRGKNFEHWPIADAEAPDA